jgi:hypothetical protein
MIDVHDNNMELVMKTGQSKINIYTIQKCKKYTWAHMLKLMKLLYRTSYRRHRLAGLANAEFSFVIASQGKNGGCCALSSGVS